MTIWLTSDQHFGHKNIIKYCNRPFKDADEMTETLIENHNSVVKKEDTVINVGDFALSYKRIPEILKRLNGRQVLVPGNHDVCHPAHKQYNKENGGQDLYYSYGFAQIYGWMGFRLENFLIQHMPYTKDERHGERFEQYRPANDAKTWLLHGHVHQLWKIDFRRRMINVGVDVWDYKPVSLEQLVSLRIS